jgi:hypothetical protein
MVLRKARHFGRLGGCTTMLVVQFSVIKTWSEVLRSRTMLSGCNDKKLCSWCITSWDEIPMVHARMKNG